MLVAPGGPFKFESGVPFSSVIVPDLSQVYAGAAEVVVYNGFGHGFIFERVILNPVTGSPTSFPQILAVEVLGVGKQSHDTMYCTTDKFYSGPFQQLKIISLPGSTEPYPIGQLVCNVAIKPYAGIYPSASPEALINTPAIVGGTPAVRVTVESQALTRAAPTLGTEGTVIQSASLLMVMLATMDDGAPSKFTGGAIDIWRYNTVVIPAHSLVAWGWTLAMAGIPIPTGASQVTLPFNNALSTAIGVRDMYTGSPPGTDRLLAVANGITTDGTAATVRVVTMVQ